MKNINKKILFASLVGTSFEFYEFVVYGFLAPIVSPLFFPSNEPAISLISGLGVFALGFLARPIGGLVFGYIGDHYGRKKALSLSIILMSIPTCLIGLLPTYASIGWLAPLFLMVCRLLQGICTGGEYNGAGIFLVEHTKEGKKGLASGILVAGCVTGMFLGSSVSFFMHFFDFSWRVPFLLGIIPGVIGYYIRRSIEESPIFEIAKKKKKMEREPILRLIKKEELINMFRAAGIASFAASLFYFLYIFCNSFIPEISKVSQEDLVGILTGAAVMYMVFLLILGWISDYIGHASLMKFAAVTTAIFLYPAFSYLVVDGSVLDSVLFLLLFSFLLAAYVAPSHTVMVSLFPVKGRYRLISLSYSLGLSILGGTAPMFSMILFREIGTPSSPTFFVIFCALLGLGAVYSLPHEQSLFNIRAVLRRFQRNQTNAFSSIEL